MKKQALFFLSVPLMASQPALKRIKVHNNEQIEQQGNFFILGVRQRPNTGNINAANHAGETVLTKAARDNNLTFVQSLLASERINLQSSGSQQALFWAVQHGNGFMVKALVEAGVPINSQTPETNYTPLMLAVFKNYQPIVQLLLTHEAINVFLQNADGDTALSLAKKLNQKKIAQALESYLKKALASF